MLKSLVGVIWKRNFKRGLKWIYGLTQGGMNQKARNKRIERVGEDKIWMRWFSVKYISGLVCGESQ